MTNYTNLTTLDSIKNNKISKKNSINYNNKKFNDNTNDTN